MAKVLTPDDVIRDITHDLPSLQYNVHLTDLELALIPLRKRNHELLLHACSQAAFLVSVLNELTHAAFSSDDKNEGLPRQRVSIGIIGGGRLCGHLVRNLLHHAKCHPHDISISTYQPENIKHLAAIGVSCCHDNRSIIEHSDITFVTIPSHQIQILAREMKPFKNPMHFMVPYIMSRSLTDLLGLLDHENILKTEYLFNYQAAEGPDTPYSEIEMCLEDLDVVEKCFPLAEAPEGELLGHVYSGPEWVRDAIVVFYRHTLALVKSPAQALNILNTVLLADCEDKLIQKCFLIAGTPPRMADLPEQLADLASVGAKMTYLNVDLESGKFSKALTDKFLSVFESKKVDLSKYDR